MKIVDAETVYSLLSYRQMIEGLKRLHLEDTNELKDMLLSQAVENTAGNHLLIRAAWQHGRALGVKLASIFPGNNDIGLPGIHAAYVMFDGDTGVPIASIDGNALTHRKTAGDSALGSYLLSRKNAKTLLMVGAGTMASHLTEAHVTARDSIDDIYLWNRTRSRAQTLADQLKTNKVFTGRKLTVTDNLESAVKQADIVSCATMTTDPIINGTWLKPGTHLDLIGAFKPDMREADDECLRRASLFVDSRKTTIGEIGELIIPMTSGVITEQDVLADLYDLCRDDHSGRTSEDEITIFKNGGGGHLDLMTARLVMEKLKD